MCQQEPLRQPAGGGIIGSAYDVSKKNRVWTAVRKGTGLTMKERTHLIRNVDDNVIVVHIKRLGEKSIIIVNIYDQRTRQTGERPARRLRWQIVIRQEGGGMVLLGDFNPSS